MAVYKSFHGVWLLVGGVPKNPIASELFGNYYFIFSCTFVDLPANFFITRRRKRGCLFWDRKWSGFNSLDFNGTFLFLLWEVIEEELCRLIRLRRALFTYTLSEIVGQEEERSLNWLLNGEANKQSVYCFVCRNYHWNWNPRLDEVLVAGDVVVVPL